MYIIVQLFKLQHDGAIKHSNKIFVCHTLNCKRYMKAKQATQNYRSCLKSSDLKVIYALLTILSKINLYNGLSTFLYTFYYFYFDVCHFHQSVEFLNNCGHLLTVKYRKFVGIFQWNFVKLFYNY